MASQFNVFGAESQRPLYLSNLHSTVKRILSKNFKATIIHVYLKLLDACNKRNP